MIANPHKMRVPQAMTKYFPDNVHCKVISGVVGYDGRTWILGNRHLKWLWRTPRLISELVEFRPDIVLTDYPTHPSWHTKLYSLIRLHHVPLVAWLRGDSWSEHFAFFSNAGFPTKLLGPLTLFSWSTGLRFADRILTICGWLERIVTERFPGKNTSVLYQGIDPEPWLAQESSSDDFEKPAVGILQHNHILPKVRGLLWFSSVVRKMEDVNFYIAGGGRYTYLVQREYSGIRNAHLVGRMHHPDGVRRFLQSMDVYVLPSGLDCCPLTLLEASLCERPVVASRVGGVPEIVVNGETGWTLPNGETDIWVERLRALLDDEDLSRRLGSNGRQFVLDNFSWRTQAPRLASIFKQELELRNA